jgi:hypothetical protein
MIKENNTEKLLFEKSWINKKEEEVEKCDIVR